MQKTFRQYLKKEENRELYASLVPKDLIARRERLSKMVDDAYRRGDQKNAERLDAQLEELDEKIESMLADMDDKDGEDLYGGDTGNEEERLDWDWSVQEEMAKIYARYLAGDFYDTEETVEVDPKEAKKKGWEYRQGIDHNGKPVNRFYRLVPVTRQQALAKVLRGAIWDSSFARLNRVKMDVINAMTDDQIMDAAKDAYEWKRGLHGRIKGTP